ncbi:MAG: caspase family protein [Alphaproteobacteria bacterium]|nr:caspase family protein [Alphaproteobacteria bacterium]
MIKNALVVGNSEYECMEKLKNPVNDTIDIAYVLSEFGFETTIAENIVIEEMDSVVASFKENIEEADVVLFYFAGHGFQVEGRNYLATIDTASSDIYSLKRTSFELNSILEMFDNCEARTKIIILDACRNNPLVDRFVVKQLLHLLL